MNVRLGLATLVLWLLASIGAAQDVTAQLELAVDARAAELIDANALGAAIGRELSLTIVPTAVETSRDPRQPRLTIEALSRARVRLVLVRADATTLERTTRLHTDADERVATLVILAANLVRDEAGELLAMLHRPEVVDGESASESVSVSVSANESESEAVDARAAPVDEAVQEQLEDAHEEEVVAPSTPPAPGPSAPPAPSAPHDPFLRLGLTSALGSTPHGDGYDLAWLAGLEIAATPLPFLAVGVRELGGGYAQNGQWSVGGAVFGELAWRFVDFADLHGAIGAHVQYIGDRNETAGVAPLVLVGARLYADRVFSIAIDTAVRVVASSAFHTGTAVVPQGAVLWTGGLSLTFHID